MTAKLKKKKQKFYPSHVAVSQGKLMRVVHKLTFVNRKKNKEAFCLSIRKYLDTVEGKPDWMLVAGEIRNRQGRVMATVEHRRMKDREIRALELV